MADAPRPGAKPALESLLGAEGCARLQRVLLARAIRWATRHGDAWVAYGPHDARAEVAALAPPGTPMLAQTGAHRGERLAAAFRAVAEAHGGPVVVIGSDQPTLGPVHAWGAADDLHEIDVTLGPATHGGYYLLGARRFHPALFAIAPDAWGGPDVMALTLESVLGAGLSVGWLRSERDLDAPADAAALLADPCSPADVVAALRR